MDLYDREGPANGCHCAQCWPRYPRFRACPTCGNKRCPKTGDHRFRCTNSNETGQVGEVEDGEHQVNGPMRMGPPPSCGTPRGQEDLDRQFRAALLGLVGEYRRRGLDHRAALGSLRATIAGEEAIYAARDRSLDHDGGRL